MFYNLTVPPPKKKDKFPSPSWGNYMNFLHIQNVP